MKNLTAATATHVAQDVTTLAACWRITRTDGTVHRFTDHDVDVRFAQAHTLTVQLQANETFISVGAFSRSAIEAKAGLRIDNLDLTGLVNADDVPGGIDLQDLVARKFTDALVEVFLVNWAAPDDGVVPMARGHVGDVTLDRDAGTYTAEMRGLSQRFTRKLAQLYSPTCRADLFDSRCGLDSDDYVQRTVVESVTSNREFTVPANAALLDPEPGLDSGLRTRAAQTPSGTLALRKGPAELGTRDAPILVSTPAGLDGVRDNPFAWYALANDVDMGSFGFWTPIPDFRGGFDGRGYEVQNLDCDRPGNGEADGDSALFGALLQGALVRRLGIRGGRFQSGNSLSYFAAPLAARTDASDRTGTYGAVEDCYTVGCQVISDSTGAGDRLSGLVGKLRGLRTVRRCFAASVLSAPAAAFNWSTRVGNLLSETDSQAMESCYSDDDRQGVGDFYQALPDTRYGTGEDDEGGVAQLTTAESADSANSLGLDYALAWLEPENQAAVAMSASSSPLETLTFASGSPDTVMRDVGSWVADGFRAGDRVLVSGAGVQVTTSPTTLTSGSALSSATLDTLNTTGVDLVAEGWVAGMVAVVAGTDNLDGAYLVVGVTTTQLKVAPGIVLPVSAAVSGATITASNDRYFDLAAVTATVLSLVDSQAVVPQAGVDATSVSVAVARFPVLREQPAA